MKDEMKDEVKTYKGTAIKCPRCGATESQVLQKNESQTDIVEHNGILYGHKRTRPLFPGHSTDMCRVYCRVCYTYWYISPALNIGVNPS